MAAGLHKAAMSATQATKRGCFTKSGGWIASPCMTGEFIEKLLSLKIVFSKPKAMRYGF
jgi:hypothetical protein